MNLYDDYKRDYALFGGSLDDYKKMRWGWRVMGVLILLGIALAALALWK